MGNPVRDLINVTLGLPRAKSPLVTDEDNELDSLAIQADEVAGSTSNAIFSVISESTSAHASNTVVPSYFQNTMKTASGVGRAMEAKLIIDDVKLGAWSNAARFLVDCQTTGRITGLLSCINGEMVMPGGASEGTLAIYEAEIVCPASFVASGDINVMYIAASGATVGEFDDHGYLFTLTGVSSNAAHVWFDQTEAAASAANEWIRVKTPGGVRYLALYDAVGSP